jgi:hypothetical protein
VIKSKELGDRADAHALIRGLRRGIGLYINDVSLATYKRVVQRLATRGKLAVVFSDESLAFGVNMPFRSCIFCGDMGGERAYPILSYSILSYSILSYPILSYPILFYPILYFNTSPYIISTYYNK